MAGGKEPQWKKLTVSPLADLVRNIANKHNPVSVSTGRKERHDGTEKREKAGSKM